MEVLMGGDTRLVGAAVARALKQIEEGEKGNFWAL
jgi:predicted RecA/RadA family phage recombinase